MNLSDRTAEVSRGHSTHGSEEGPNGVLGFAGEGTEPRRAEHNAENSAQDEGLMVEAGERKGGVNQRGPEIRLIYRV